MNEKQRLLSIMQFVNQVKSVIEYRCKHKPSVNLLHFMFTPENKSESSKIQI